MGTQEWIGAYNREQFDFYQRLVDPKFRQELRDRASTLPNQEYVRISQWLDQWDHPPFPGQRVA